MSDTQTPALSAPLFQEIGQAQVRTATTPFQSPQGLAVVTTIALCIKAALSLGQFAGLIMRLKVLDDIQRLGPALGATLQSDAHRADIVVQASAGVGLLALIACYVVGGMWIYRTARNVRALGAKGIETSPGWAVGFFAVPIMNWFRPLLAMSEIWRASQWPDRWRSQPMPPLLGFWWAGWIATGVVGNFVYFATQAGKDLSLVKAINQASALDVALELITMGLFLTIVWQVTRAQQATRHQVLQVADTFA